MRVVEGEENSCPSTSRFPLAANARCTLGFEIAGLSKGTYTLAPEVRQFNPKVYCSQPSVAHQVKVTVGDDWALASDSSPGNGRVMSLASIDNTLYAGTYGTGVWHLENVEEIGK